MRKRNVDRRRLMIRAAEVAGAALVLGGCDRLVGSDTTKAILASAERLTERLQHLVSPAQSLAREYTETDLSPEFRANGTVDPDDDDYQEQSAKGFADWSLDLGGLVERPAKFSLADLRALQSRTQITRHDCVEGWSCIGKWKGVQLARVLDLVKLKPEAKYLVFICADELEKTLDGTGRYYASHGLEDAFHPQTLLAYELIGETLPVAHGAPARLS